MKKWIFLILAIAVIGSGMFLIEKNLGKTPQSVTNKKLEEEDYKDFINNPADYVGYSMSAEGLVEESKFIKSEGVYTTLILNEKEYEDIIVLYEKEGTKEFEPRTTVDFEGKVARVYKDKKTFNRTINLPKINVTSIKVNDYPKEKNNRKSKELAIGQSKSKQNVQVKVENIELNESSTRVHIKIQNNSKQRIYLNEGNAFLEVDGESISSKYEMLDKNLRLATSLDATDGTEGVLTFNEIDRQSKQLKLILKIISVENDAPIEFKYTIELQ